MIAIITTVGLSFLAMGYGTSLLANSSTNLSVAMGQSLAFVFVFNLGMALLANAGSVADFLGRRRRALGAKFTIASLSLILIGLVGVGYGGYTVLNDPVRIIIMGDGSELRHLDPFVNPEALFAAYNYDNDKEGGYPHLSLVVKKCNGYQINKKGKDGFNIIYRGIKTSNVDKVRLILSNKEFSLKTPMHKPVVYWNFTKKAYRTPLQFAIDMAAETQTPEALEVERMIIEEMRSRFLTIPDEHAQRVKEVTQTTK